MAISRPSQSRHPLQYFTRLGPDNHKITSEVSAKYNCIAWAAGIDNQQIWPDGTEGIEDESAIVWPAGIRNDETVESFIEYFVSLGYVLCDGPDFGEGFLKVALFVKEGCPKHACRQLPSGKWTSKMGTDGVDIELDDLDLIAGTRYGSPSIFLKRSVDEKVG